MGKWLYSTLVACFLLLLSPAQKNCEKVHTKSADCFSALEFHLGINYFFFWFLQVVYCSGTILIDLMCKISRVQDFWL